MVQPTNSPKDFLCLNVPMVFVNFSDFSGNNLCMFEFVFHIKWNNNCTVLQLAKKKNETNQTCDSSARNKHGLSQRHVEKQIPLPDSKIRTGKKLKSTYPPMNECNA